MDKQKIYILNPDYKFKNDEDRVVMYSQTDVRNDSEKEWIGFIHPYQALLLGLFTNESTFEEHCNEISTYFNMPLLQVEEMMSQYVENKGAIYNKNEGTFVKFPKNVLIPFEGQLPDYDFCQDDLMCKTVDINPDRMHKAPHSALFMLNNHCLTDCLYCYADKRTKCDELTTEEIFGIIDNAKRLKMAKIDVIGGELFIKKDWDKILERLVSYNMSPSFISTKVPVTEKIIEKLKRTRYT